MKKKQYNHTEAFCVMSYRCEKCKYNELLWNSRDGVTPFIINCTKCNGMMQHVCWEKDRCIPNFKPFKGMRIFIDLTKTEWKAYVKKMINRQWNTLSPMSKSFKNKKEAFKHLTKKFEKHQPTIKEATE